MTAEQRTFVDAMLEIIMRVREEDAKEFILRWFGEYSSKDSCDIANEFYQVFKGLSEESKE